MGKLIATFVFSLLVSTHLTRAENPTSIRGYGNSSCGSWTQEQRNRSPAAFAQESWLLGFVTAEELTSPEKRYKNPDNAAVIAWVSNYCAKSPLVSIAQAAFALTLELRNDPANLKKAMEAVRSGLRRACASGDKKACASLEQSKWR